MMTKRNVLFVGITAFAAAALLWVLYAKFGLSCEYVNENGHTTRYCGAIILSLLPLISLIPFSVILYFFRDEVFRAWLHFAYWWVPILVVVTYFSSINFGTRTGGAYGFGGVGQWLLLELLYGVFIFVSFFRIIRAYLKARRI